MTRIYKTAKGKSIDMDKIKLSNETTPAVGNMRVNARGDILGAGGAVVQGRNQIMDQAYAVSATPTSGYSPNDSKKSTPPVQTKSKSLHDLANGLVVPTTPEPIAKEEPVTENVETTTEETPSPVATARGSLASSVAKAASVNQGPIPNAKKIKKPSRI